MRPGAGVRVRMRVGVRVRVGVWVGVRVRVGTGVAHLLSGVDRGRLLLSHRLGVSLLAHPRQLAHARRLLRLQLEIGVGVGLDRLRERGGAARLVRVGARVGVRVRL